MGDDLEFLGQPDPPSAVARAGKDISFGSVSQFSQLLSLFTTTSENDKTQLTDRV
jgi:hypothetical protein